MELLARYFLYFIIYAAIGWVIEVIWTSIQIKRFVNRGYLLGPLCPIYGFGAIIILLLVGTDSTDLLSVFLKSVFVCSVLEYVTSFTMEKLFKTRWWDYSDYKFNLNGRICLAHMISFGLLGVFVILFSQPFIEKIIALLPTHILFIISGAVLILYISDNIISYIVMQRIRKKIKSVDKDNTELIKRYMLEWLGNNSILYRRIKNAYPNFVINISNLTKKSRKR